jgi:hypothetical protein
MSGVAIKRQARSFQRNLRLYRLRNEPVYQSPTENELLSIEADLNSLGITVSDYSPDPTKFKIFQEEAWFPQNYFGGIQSEVWVEKLLEHWLASELLGLDKYSSDDIYVDIAACNSPWAMTLRQRRNIAAFAIDISPIPATFSSFTYYKQEDATKTSFASKAVRGASLQCAYEMFVRDNDINLIAELGRILLPGGKVVIAPLYMHTHYCAYSTPEYYGKGYVDEHAKEYLRTDCLGVPSSRKYDAAELKRRVLDPIVKAGMKFQLLAIRNKAELGKGVYCHFILVIENA